METTIHIDNVTIHTHVEGKPLYLTPQRAAEEVGLSVSYIKEVIREGLLPSFKGEGTGGRVLIKTDELVAFLETRRVVRAN
jgi:excisionase family DNA binding protein